MRHFRRIRLRTLLLIGIAFTIAPIAAFAQTDEIQVYAGRIVYNISNTWDVAAEEYDGFGRFSSFENLHNQFHEVWGAFDRNGKIWDIEAGAGLGLTVGFDRWTLKLMISRDINNKPWHIGL